MKPEKTPDNSWMKKYMKGNCCTINFKVFEKAIPSLENICTSLEKRVWNDTVSYTHLDVYKRQNWYRWYMEKMKWMHIMQA